MKVPDHRDRLREKYQSFGETALDDFDILELLLFRSTPQRDTKLLATALLERFGTLAGIFGAPSALLQEVKGVSKAIALELKLIGIAGQRMLKNEMRSKKVLSSSSTVIDYCRAAMAHEPREQVRVLFLNKRHMLIADEVQGHGTVDHAPVYPREVMRRALELSATGVILVHNHPSGDPTPSNADIDMTKMIINASKLLGITVYDHIIIGRDGHASLKMLRMF
ncbi:DNA repair protein RadC [Neorhizobium galegae bv. officinalis]|uniref:DNA repair protein RadC n=1 Tax=Neorhizobium galegae bv. officinalis TaxID=323656 RepID=A0A0T7GFN5_NEOGA|nr:DNA repair protein RadC [Neorhizobium galegae]CDZ45998.1 DNA repair protein RadC [Neorhizobium galegae bv. officinalis]